MKKGMGSDARDRHGNSPPRGAERGFPGWSPLAGEEQRPVQGRARKEVGTRAATTVSGRVQTPECPGDGEGGREGRTLADSLGLDATSSERAQEQDTLLHIMDTYACP